MEKVEIVLSFVKSVLRFALILSGIFVAFTQIFPQVILSIYNIPSSLIGAGETALRLFSISLLGVTLTFLLMYSGGNCRIWSDFRVRKMVCKNSGGKLTDIFLIEKSDPELLMDVSFSANTDNATKISQDARAVLEQKNFDSTVALKVGVALEEMTLNIEKLNAGQKIDVDLRIKRGEGKIIIALRDNGKSFNPLEYSVPKEEIF